MIPSRIKNAALTELPMIPPMVLKLSNREEMAAAVAATTIEVMMTILAVDQFTYKNIGGLWTHVEWPNEKKVPTVTGFCPVASSRRVIKSMA